MVERLLSDIIQEPTYPPEVQAVREELAELVGADAVLARIQELYEEAATKPLSRRYRKDFPVGYYMGGLKNPAPGFANTTEETHQREHLKVVFRTLGSDFLALAGRIDSAFLELRAAQMEFEPPEPAS